MASKNASTKQQALLLHIEDAKALCIDPKVSDKFVEWAEKTCQSFELEYAKVFMNKNVIT